MQHIDVRDLAAFMVALLGERSLSLHGRYILPGPYLTWSEPATVLDKVSGRPLRRNPAKGWVFRVIGRCYDIKRHFTVVDSPVSYETMRYIAHRNYRCRCCCD